MKLEYGKRYVTRGGEVTGPLSSLDSASHPYIAETESTGTESWTGDGKYFSSNIPSYRDLVSEYTEPATQEPQSGLTKREFMQQFVLSRVGLLRVYTMHSILDKAQSAWSAIEEKCK